jgi:hypothetical protein
MSFVVRRNGATVVLPSGADSFAFEVNAIAYAQLHSTTTWPGEALTVHDGDAATERSVVAVFRDGVQVGPTHEDKGY